MACADFSPRFSFSRDLPVKELQNGEQDFGDADFEFCMVLSEDPRSSGGMLSADELFFQGMLRPLQPALEPPLPLRESNSVRQDSDPEPNPFPSRVPEAGDPRSCEIAAAPRANKPSGKWKGLLGFKKLNISAPPPPPSKSLKKLLTGADSKRFDRATSGAGPATSRLSISSSSSSSLPDLCSAEFPRRSVDSRREDAASLGKSLRVNVEKSQEKSHEKSQSGKRVSRRGPPTNPLDSPRISASGKIVFRSLERSCSSPGSFSRCARRRGNSARQLKDDHRQGLERSYSENIRVSPVLHVPVGISPSFRSVKAAASKGGIFGLGHLFSLPQKKENGGRRTRCPSLSTTSVEGSKIFGL